MVRGRPKGSVEPVWNKPCCYCGRVLRTRGGYNNHLSNVHKDIRDRVRVCSVCAVERPISDFPKVSGTPYYRSACYDCKNESGRKYSARVQGERTAAQRRDRNKASRIRFGLTLEEYDAKVRTFLEEQGYLCPACGLDLKEHQYHLDHHHSTMFVRGVLCRNCNIALGLAKDSPEVLRNLARYLELTHRNYLDSLQLPTTTEVEKTS